MSLHNTKCLMFNLIYFHTFTKQYIAQNCDEWGIKKWNKSWLSHDSVWTVDAGINVFRSFRIKEALKLLFVLVVRWCGTPPTKLVVEWHCALTEFITMPAIIIERKWTIFTLQPFKMPFELRKMRYFVCI